MKHTNSIDPKVYHEVELDDKDIIEIVLKLRSLIHLKKVKDVKVVFNVPEDDMDIYLDVCKDNPIKISFYTEE